MKENRSLALSYEINNLMQQDLAGIFYDLFPFEKLSKMSTSNVRDRVFNAENTILTMILTMTSSDKTLQNSVGIYSGIHLRNKERIEEMDRKIREEYLNPQAPRSVGRPRETIGRIARSKTKSISHSTSAYTQARQRLAKSLFEMVYRDSADFSDIDCHSKWYGRPVFITDGTYLQMQDTDSIKSEFPCPECKAYPRGLLQVVIEQGSGSVYDFALEADTKSELYLFSKMIENIPKGSLILADDLYNCFAIFALLKKRQVEIIVPGKRVRNYTVLESYAPGDELVSIKKSMDSKWLINQKIADKVLQLRRISYKSANQENTELILYTSVLDKSITKEEIIMKYESRWDIEVSIREIKTIMDINIVRSKSADTAYKEVASALIAYNYIRKIIAKSTENSAFSPEGDIFQKCYEGNKKIFVDKLGRKYSRWSPGRLGYSKRNNTEL